MRRAILKEAAKRFPWLVNVTLYVYLFVGGDLVHQLMAQKESIDWIHMRNVAIVATSFQGNFNYVWRLLHRVSFLEGKEDVFEDWMEKFFNTWKWLNFVLMPLHLHTAFMGCCGFLWATFLCFSQHSSDGTVSVALAFLVDPRHTLETVRHARLARNKDKDPRVQEEK